MIPFLIGALGQQLLPAPPGPGADCWLLVNNIATPSQASQDIKAAAESYGHTTTYKAIADAVDTSKVAAIGTPELPSGLVDKYANNADIAYLLISSFWNDTVFAQGSPVANVLSTDVDVDAGANAGPFWWPSSGAEGTQVALFNNTVTFRPRTSFLPSGRDEVARSFNNSSQVIAIAIPEGDTLAPSGAALSHQAAIAYNDYTTTANGGFTAAGETFLGEMIDAVSGVAGLGPIEYVSKGTTFLYQAGTSTVVDLPPDTVSGDLLVAVFGINNNPGSLPSSTGWTNLLGFNNNGDDQRQVIMYRVADGTEGATATFTGFASFFERTGAVFAWRGVDQVTPFDSTQTRIPNDDPTPDSNNGSMTSDFGNRAVFILSTRSLTDTVTALTVPIGSTELMTEVDTGVSDRMFVGVAEEHLAGDPGVGQWVIVGAATPDSCVSTLVLRHA